MINKTNLSAEQDMAANPNENVWVQANAGTGKTSVLVQRLLRILFRSFNNNSINSGVLCLTYTNAGASEMRNRILNKFRDWAISSDTELTELLNGIRTGQKKPDDLSQARNIFYHYIDNPDVLKIKTIHSFCEEILHRFPLEAGVSPAWKLISDTNQKILLRDNFHNLINYSKQPAINEAFAHIVGRISETKFDELLRILTDQYKQFFQVNNISEYRQQFIDNIKYFLNITNVKNTEIPKENLMQLLEMAESEQNQSKTPKKYITNIINLTKQYIDNTINFEEYKNAYLIKNGTKNTNVSKKDFLVPEQDRVYNINQQNQNEQIFNDTVALFDLSAAFAENYKKLKYNRNLLDFDDLILYTKQLFSSPDAMGWVLSQLDLQIGHILVDEAQDTSPQQWDIMKMLSGDFFTTGNKSENNRSLFVVGDTKQSIYGFQGADPNVFAHSRQEIAENIQENYRTIQEIPLTQSFRSANAILKTVDMFFGDNKIHELSGFINNKHTCFRTNANGLVELNKFASSKEDVQDSENKLSADMARKTYIKNISDKIENLVKTDGYSEKDIMILVQRRNPFVSPIIRELKSRNINVAGSDRIVLPEYPAIRDFLNLTRFCLNNSDDYSLCCALKSPFYRLKEADIYKICKLRTETKNTDKTATVFNVLKYIYPEIYNEISEILEKSKILAPYSFFMYLLTTHNYRTKMIAALGNQIIDPLEEFLTICLSYERTQPGNLHHFIKWFITSGSEIKRDMDSNAGLRIVTIHGSKGLESPIVFLIDTIRTPIDKPEKIIKIRPQNTNHNEFKNFWLWLPEKSNSERAQVATDESLAGQIAEYYRLLYVAMTRARDRLYIYGFGTTKNPPEIAWHTKLTEILSENADTIKEDDMIRVYNE